MNSTSDAAMLAYSHASPADMLPMVQQFADVKTPIVDLFFSRDIYSPTGAIEFGLKRKGRPVAPYVIPTSSGTPMRDRGVQLYTWKPPYFKPTETVVPGDVKKPLYQHGEQPFTGGQWSMKKRADVLIAENFQLNDDMFKRRKEQQGCALLQHGEFMVEGEDAPPDLVSYPVPANFKTTLTGAAQWANATCTPLTDIGNKAMDISKESGAVAAIVLSRSKNWNEAKATAEVQAAFDVNKRVGDSSATGVIANGTGLTRQAVFTTEGDSAVNIEWWTYDEFYEDENGDSVPYLEEDLVVVAAEDIGGWMGYGPIEDFEAIEMNGALQQHFPKIYRNPNPSKLDCISQSSFMPLAQEIGSWGVLDVN